MAHEDLDIAGLESQLAALPAEQLAELIAAFLQEHPEWLPQVATTVAAHQQFETNPVDRSEIKQRARTIVEVALQLRRPWTFPRWFEALESLQRRGNALLNDNAIRNAATVYGALLEVVITADEELNPGVADYEDFVLRLTQRLLTCLRQLHDDEQRRTVLRDLWRVWLYDAARGGRVDYHFLWDAFLDDTTLEERNRLAECATSRLTAGFSHPEMLQALLRELDAADT